MYVLVRRVRQDNAHQNLARQRKRSKVAAASTWTPDLVDSTPNLESLSSSPSPCKAISCPSVSSPPQGDATACPLEKLEANFEYCTADNITYNRAVLKRFAEHALESYATAAPCADHRLKLIQLNLINGMTRNASSLGFTFDWLLCEVISPFGRGGPSLNPGAANTAAVPPSLAPTSLQLRTRHHPWLDLFPLPILRDNILAASQFLTAEDEQDLYNDVLEVGGGRSEWAGLVVWGEPSDPWSWEISLPFLRKWGWLLRGCPEIVQATNFWRSRRGEGPLPCSRHVEEVYSDSIPLRGLPSKVDSAQRKFPE